MLTGRCIGAPSSEMLGRARGWIAAHLEQLEAEWRTANPDDTCEATPVAAHAHLWNLLHGLTPTRGGKASFGSTMLRRAVKFSEGAEAVSGDDLVTALIEFAENEVALTEDFSVEALAKQADDDIRDPFDHIEVALEDHTIGDTVTVNAQLLAKLFKIAEPLRPEKPVESEDEEE